MASDVIALEIAEDLEAALDHWRGGIVAEVHHAAIVSTVGQRRNP